MQDVLLNMANRELLEFCKENNINPSGTHVEKMGRGFRYKLVRDGHPLTTVPYVSVLFSKNNTPQFTMDDDAKAQRTHHIERLRNNMPGYILGDLTPFATDSDVLEVALINDRKAEIHNRAFSQQKYKSKQ